MPTISAAATALLEQNGLAGRVESVRFDLLDADGNVIGEVHPQEGVSVQNSTEGALKRSLSGFLLPPDEAASIDIRANRVRPMWLLQGVADEFPLGVFVWSSASTKLWSYGSWLPGSLLDLGLSLAQGIAESVSINVGDSVRSKIIDVLTLAGFTSMNVEASDVTAESALAWVPSGQNTYAAILSQLAALGGYYDHYLDNYGVPTLRRVIDTNAVVAPFVFEYGGRIVDGSVVIENDGLRAPNRYVCIDTAATGGSVTGIYDLPADDPNSYARRRVRITRHVEAPGVGTVAAAEERARAAAQQDVRAYEIVKFQSLPDPRHDTFDVVQFLGNNYIELGWTLDCSPGGSMEHTIKRVYA